jgi:mitogen-activated protein kinase kinase
VADAPRAQEHPFLKADRGRDVDMVGWVAGALQARAERLGLSPTTSDASSSSASPSPSSASSGPGP